jgi:hypothetical protein
MEPPLLVCLPPSHGAFDVGAKYASSGCCAGGAKLLRHMEAVVVLMQHLAPKKRRA